MAETVRRRRAGALGHDKVLIGAYGLGTTALIGAANRVFLTPVWVPHRCYIDDLVFNCTTQSVGKSFRLALYQQVVTYESETPVGARLLAESGNISATGTGAKQWTPAASVSVEAGYLWVAIETEDAVMAFGRMAAVQPFATAAYANLSGCYYDLGGFGAFANPCPAVTALNTTNFAIQLHTIRWDLNG